MDKLPDLTELELARREKRAAEAKTFKVCPTCGHWANRSDAKTCEKCGADLIGIESKALELSDVKPIFSEKEKGELKKGIQNLGWLLLVGGMFILIMLFLFLWR